MHLNDQPGVIRLRDDQARISTVSLRIGEQVDENLDEATVVDNRGESGFNLGGCMRRFVSREPNRTLDDRANGMFCGRESDSAGIIVSQNHEIFNDPLEVRSLFRHHVDHLDSVL